MRKSTKTALTIGAIAAIAGAGGAIAYAKMHAVTPAGTLPAGTLMTSVTLKKGTKYVIAAVLPASIKDQASLASALTDAGWTNVVINVFNGSGTAPSGGLVAPVGGYIASATWNGMDGTANPANVEIVPVA